MKDVEILRALLSSPEGRELIRRLNDNGSLNAANYNNANLWYPGGNPQWGNNCNSGFDDWGLLILLFLLFCCGGCWW